MSSEWTLKRLGDHCEKIGSGATPKGGKDSYLDEGPVHLIRSQNIYNDGFTPSGLAYISDVQAEKLSNVAVKAGDVLLNITGDSVARVCQAPAQYMPARVNQHVAIIRPKSIDFDAQYLRYFLASPLQQNFMLGLASAGATRNALTKAMIEDFQVPCPSLDVQHQIAQILGSLDNCITLLRETNATLEAIAQALFKSWFVDFDPVHAKQQGRAPEGMDAQTAALFPDSFEESELGILPKGWSMRKLSEAYEINPFRKLSKGQAATYLDMANVPTQGYSVGELVERDFGSGTKFKNHDTLLARITPCLENGKTAYVDFLSDDEAIAWGSTEFIVLRPKAPLPPFHAYLLSRSQVFREHAIQSMSGTSGRQRVQNDMLGMFPVVVPCAEVAAKFSEITGAIQAKSSANEAQAKTLVRLRETLLPRLISGQLRLPEVKDLAEDAAEHA